VVPPRKKQTGRSLANKSARKLKTRAANASGSTAANDVIAASAAASGTPKKASSLGANLKRIRQRHSWSLTQVAQKTRLSRSTLYKVENAGVSLTYDKILQLSDGLEIDLAELFGRAPDAGTSATPTRRSLGRSLAEGNDIDTANIAYTYLCNDLLRKRVIPIVARVKARSINEYPELPRHSGEEFDLVLEGEVEVHTEFYEVVRLKQGEFIYLDSMMGHAFVTVGDKDAVVLTVCSSIQGAPSDAR